MHYKDLTTDLVKKALNLGADSAEVYLQTGRQLSVRVRNADIETIQEAASSGIGFRVIVDDKMGFSHCNNLSIPALEETIAKAVAFAKLTTPDKNNVLPSEVRISDVGGLHDPEIAAVSMEDKIGMALSLEEYARKDPRITHSSGSSFCEWEGEVFIANSNGICKSYKSSTCSLSVGVVAEKGDQKRTGWDYCSRRFFSDLESLEDIAERAARNAWELLDQRMVRTQKASVIIDRDVASSFLGGIISAINGESVLQNVEDPIK